MTFEIYSRPAAETREDNEVRETTSRQRGQLLPANSKVTPTISIILTMNGQIEFCKCAIQRTGVLEGLATAVVRLFFASAVSQREQ